MKEHTKFLIPKKGLIVRNPVTKDILPEKGMAVTWMGPEGRYWKRRVNCGDCIISTPMKTTIKKTRQGKAEE